MLLLGEMMGEGAAGVGGTAVAAVVRESTDPAALTAGDEPLSMEIWSASMCEAELGPEGPSRTGVDAVPLPSKESGAPLEAGVLGSAGPASTHAGWQTATSRLYV